MMGDQLRDQQLREQVLSLPDKMADKARMDTARRAYDDRVALEREERKAKVKEEEEARDGLMEVARQNLATRGWVSMAELVEWEGRSQDSLASSSAAPPPHDAEWVVSTLRRGGVMGLGDDSVTMITERGILVTGTRKDYRRYVQPRRS